MFFVFNDWRIDAFLVKKRRRIVIACVRHGNTLGLPMFRRKCRREYEVHARFQFKLKFKFTTADDFELNARRSIFISFEFKSGKRFVRAVVASLFFMRLALAITT